MRQLGVVECSMVHFTETRARACAHTRWWWGCEDRGTKLLRSVAWECLSSSNQKQLLKVENVSLRVQKVSQVVGKQTQWSGLLLFLPFWII